MGAVLCRSCLEDSPQLPPTDVCDFTNAYTPFTSKDTPRWHPTSLEQTRRDPQTSLYVIPSPAACIPTHDVHPGYLAHYPQLYMNTPPTSRSTSPCLATPRSTYSCGVMGASSSTNQFSRTYADAQNTHAILSQVASRSKPLHINHQVFREPICQPVLVSPHRPRNGIYCCASPVCENSVPEMSKPIPCDTSIEAPVSCNTPLTISDLCVSINHENRPPETTEEWKSMHMWLPPLPPLRYPSLPHVIASSSPELKSRHSSNDHASVQHIPSVHHSSSTPPGLRTRKASALHSPQRVPSVPAMALEQRSVHSSKEKIAWQPEPFVRAAPPQPTCDYIMNTSSDGKFNVSTTQSSDRKSVV